MLETYKECLMYAYEIRIHLIVLMKKFVDATCVSTFFTKAIIIAKFVIIYVNNNIHLAYDDVIETITYEPFAYEIHR